MTLKKPIKPKPGSRRREGKPPTAHTPAENAEGLPLLRTSERKDFKRCPQRWWWAWRDGLRPSGPPNDKLWFGTGWHLVMAHLYGQPGTKRGKEPMKVWRDWVNDEIVKIRVNISGNADYKEEVYLDAANLGIEMIGNYLDTYGRDERWSMIQVEKPFEVVVVDTAGARRVLFCGTYDGVYRDLETGLIWLLEHKTAKSIYTGHLTLDDQAGGYLMVAARELRNAGLIGASEEVKGIMYNFARKAPRDDRPRNAEGLATNLPVKKHYVEQLQASPTLTLNALQELAKKRGITVVGDPSKNQPAPLFHREPITRTVRERNGMLRRLQAEVEHMEAFRNGSLPLYKTPTRDCSWDCSFYNMCVLQENGSKDWEELRSALYKPSDPYEDHHKSAAGDD